MKRLFLISLLLVVAVIAGQPASGGQRIALHVTPAVAMEPALLTVRATIEPSDENRKLTVTVDSGDYSTSSDIPLEGRNASRLSVLELHDVPSGLYEITAIVSGANGPIASSVQMVKIQPAPGHSR
jgi:hypothetical protein